MTLATTAHPDATVVWVRCPDTEGVPAWWSPAAGVPGARRRPRPGVVGARRFGRRYRPVRRLRPGTNTLERAAQTALAHLVVDDLQWADPMSLGLFTYLMSVLRGGRIIVVATARDGEGGPEVQRFRAGANRSGPRWSRCHACRVTRSPTWCWSSQEEMAPADVDLLTRRTGGNPLFVTEFARLTHHAGRRADPGGDPLDSGPTSELPGPGGAGGSVTPRRSVRISTYHC